MEKSSHRESHEMVDIASFQLLPKEGQRMLQRELPGPPRSS